MIQTLYPSFLDDAGEYAKAESLWRKHWNDLVRHAGQESLWQTPWLSTGFANGTPCRDGNPIFSAVSPSRRLGVRVIQVEPSDYPRVFEVWTDTFARDELEAVKELVITCALTDQTLQDAVDLMKKWIATGETDINCIRTKFDVRTL